MSDKKWAHARGSEDGYWHVVTQDGGYWLMYEGEARQLANDLSAHKAELARLREQVRQLREGLKSTYGVIGGWREVIAELDNMPKDEVLGKAMWACLDQIDDQTNLFRTLIIETAPEGGVI